MPLRDSLARCADDLASGFGLLSVRERLGYLGGQMGIVSTPGNGTMVALTAKDRTQVDEFYAHAKTLGCTCEGAPGERMPGFYAAYFRTPDGHKMNIFKMG